MWMVEPAALIRNGVIYQAICANCNLDRRLHISYYTGSMVNS